MRRHKFPYVIFLSPHNVRPPLVVITYAFTSQTRKWAERSAREEPQRNQRLFDSAASNRRDNFFNSFCPGRTDMSRKVKDEHYRFFTVSEPRTHDKGHTEYKVTARVSLTLQWHQHTGARQLCHHGDPLCCCCCCFSPRSSFARRNYASPAMTRSQHNSTRLTGWTCQCKASRAVAAKNSRSPQLG